MQRPAQPAPPVATEKPTAAPEPAPAPTQQRPAGQAPQQRPAGQAPQQRPAGAPPAGVPTPAPAQTAAPAAAASKQGPAAARLTAEELRRVWPRVLDEVKRRRRFTHMLLTQHAQVVDVADGLLTLGFSAAGPRENFGSGGSQDVLADALIEVIGVELRIQAVLASGEPDAAPVAQQRPTGTPVPQAAPEPERRAAPPPPPMEEETEVSVDDEVLDAVHNAEELLSSTFGAEVIAVRDADQP